MNVVDDMKIKIKTEIREAIAKAGLADKDQIPDIVLETPKEKEHGDYATNAAMQLARIAKKAPRQIAEDIVAHFDKENVSVDSIEIAGPGFINLFMDNQYLTQLVPQILNAGADYGASNTGRGEKVLVEFVSVNPTGSLHLGHARGAAIGDTLCNVMTMAGYDVHREYYNNDAGNQIHVLTQSLQARYFQALGWELAMPEGGYQGADIRQLGQDLANEYGDRFVNMADQERDDFFRAYGLRRVVSDLQEDLRDFRVVFDRWFSEKSLHDSGEIENVLARLHDHGDTYEQDGAIWFHSTAYGDDKDRVVVKADGAYTYLLPDIAYHWNKFQRGFGTLIDLLGPDHHGYIARMKAAMAALGYQPEQLQIHIYQNVNLFQNGERVRMSKRTGKTVTMRELMDEVGIDAARYFFAMRSSDTHLDFDMDLAVSASNDNPVYYVQYAHARICSMLHKGEDMGLGVAAKADMSLLHSEKEMDLLKKLGEFPEVVAQAAEKKAVQRMSNYAFDLASVLHQFYNAQKVLDAAEPERSLARFQLMVAVQTTLKNALHLIGVQAPEQM